MPKNPKKNARQVNLELDARLVDEVREFARLRGERFTDVVSQALRRHMGNPPPLPQEFPLPPVAVDPPTGVKKGKRRPPKQA